MYCEEFIAVKSLDPGIVAVPLLCRSWSCPECAERRKVQLKMLACDGNPNTIITLTVSPRFGDSPDHRARCLVRAWKEVRRRARKEAMRDTGRKWFPYGYRPTKKERRALKEPIRRKVLLVGGRLDFIAVFEHHESGEPHLHILARTRWLDQRWLADQMRQQIGAPVVYVERVKHQARVAWYVSKYIAKEPQRFTGCKRYWHSAGYRTAEAKAADPSFAEADWTLWRTTVESIVKQARKAGWTDITMHGRAVEARPPPGAVAAQSLDQAPRWDAPDCDRPSHSEGPRAPPRPPLGPIASAACL